MAERQDQGQAGHGVEEEEEGEEVLEKAEVDDIDAQKIFPPGFGWEGGGSRGRMHGS